MYRIYAETVDKKLRIGHKGENKSRCVVFDLSSYKEEFGDGTWSVVFSRSKTETPYLVANTYELDNYAVWVLDSTDTDIASEGRCELRYKVNDVLVKTSVYATLVLPSLGDTGDAPSPSEDLINKMIEIRDETEGIASEAATEAADKAVTAASTQLNVYVNNAAASAVAAAASEANAAASATTAAEIKTAIEALPNARVSFAINADDGGLDIIVREED